MTACAAGAPAPAPGLRRRLAAFVYEGVLLFGVLMIAALAYGLATQQRHALVGLHGLQLFLFLVLGLYFTWFWSHGGQTVAMKTWHVRLLATDGQPVGAARAWLRYAAELAVVRAGAGWHLSGRPAQRRADHAGLLAGVLVYALLSRFNPRRQFLHDLLSRTELVYWPTVKRKPRVSAMHNGSDRILPVRARCPCPTLAPATRRYRSACTAGHGRGAMRRTPPRRAKTGTLIGRLGWQLVYGGGRAGLMGEVADATLAAGGRVVGVIPQSLMERELGHTGLSELHVVETMHERKRLMAERSDAFLALPGGIGTLEELFEVWTWRQLGYHDKPVGLLNTESYYDRLLAFVADMADEVSCSRRSAPCCRWTASREPLLQRLGRWPPAATAPDDYSRT